MSDVIDALDAYLDARDEYQQYREAMKGNESGYIHYVHPSVERYEKAREALADAFAAIGHRQEA